jgi:transcription-repair coupling factor (superfamily II helicase)
MLTFVRGEADVLVATSIIESGLDIPQANTLVVERADQLGLSQLYQIRGRVGRSDVTAHAYLLYPDAATLSRDAASRLRALADYTELGSGLRIAMRDLEIRGAGNLLGDEQSGHVAAVGFELYLEMLNEAVMAGQGREAHEREVRVEIPVSAYIPSGYVPLEAAKIDLHRRIALAADLEEILRLRGELEDRFGPPPAPVDALLAVHGGAGEPHQPATEGAARGRLPRHLRRARADRVAPGRVGSRRAPRRGRGGPRRSGRSDGHRRLTEP